MSADVASLSFIFLFECEQLSLVALSFVDRFVFDEMGDEDNGEADDDELLFDSCDDELVSCAFRFELGDDKLTLVLVAELGDVDAANNAVDAVVVCCLVFVKVSIIKL